MADQDIAAWIREVHDALTPTAVSRSGAAWGTVTMRHRTTQQDWFGGFDAAWAVPLTAPVMPTLDVVTASLDDVPRRIAPPRIARGVLGSRGEVRSLDGTSTRMTWSEQSGEIVAWDPESASAVMLRATPPSGYDQVSPMRWLVHWSVVAAGGLLLHAACVGRSDRDRNRGVLLLGEAGYGKSTTTLGCLQEGWVTCGDDAVAVFPDDLGWHASPVYAAIKTKLAGSGIDDDSTTRQSPATVTWDIDGVKRVHLLTTTDERSVADRIDLDALILLTPQAPPEAPWHRIRDSTARTLIAPSTTLPLPFDRQRVLKRIGHLAGELPAFALPRRSTVALSVADVGAITEAAQPRVSVVVPVFDGERYVAQALESIIGQSVGCFQIVVVDDASPDDSVGVVESMRNEVEAKGHRLEVLRLRTNQGIAGARNAGLAAADGSLIAFLDQDDTWPPDRTAVLLAAMRRTRAAVAQGHMTFLDVMPGLDRPWVRDDWFGRDHVGAVMGATLCNADVFTEVGQLDADMRTGYDDVDWFSRVRDAGVGITLVPHVTVLRKVHDRNQSRRAARDQSDMFAIIRAHRSRTSGSRGEDD